MPRSRGSHQPVLTTRSVWRFIAATFVVSWGLGALVVTFMDQVGAWFGPMGYTNPAFIVTVYAPASSASSWSGATTASPASGRSSAASRCGG
jgi:hypothetical protein